MKIYHVHFHISPYGTDILDYHFSSVAAIYERFTPEDIGCSSGHLYNIGCPSGAMYFGKRCTIQRVEVEKKSVNL